MPEHGEDGYLDMNWRRLFESTRADIESTSKDVNWATAFAISSSDSYAKDLLISGAKLTFISACAFANLTPCSHSPWYRTEANVQTTRASWGLFTNVKWNASNPTLYNIKTIVSQTEKKKVIYKVPPDITMLPKTKLRDVRVCRWQEFVTLGIGIGKVFLLVGALVGMVVTWDTRVAIEVDSLHGSFPVSVLVDIKGRGQLWISLVYECGRLNKTTSPTKGNQQVRHKTCRTLK